MKCEHCGRRVGLNDGVVVWACASGEGRKFVARHVRLVHAGPCKEIFDQDVRDGELTVGEDICVERDAPLVRFAGDGDHVARMRQVYDFRQRDIFRLREIDAFAGRAKARHSLGLWSRCKKFFQTVMP